ncbi:hypothetical protein OF83DRAFT_1143374 [Amylostereum chailletii]|nr:hypothetical protein OF83DRAFT_1143374 [Amylostereum chailletii]
MSQTHSNGFFSNALHNLFRGAGVSDQPPQLQHDEDRDMTPAHQELSSTEHGVDRDEDVDMPPLTAVDDDFTSSTSSPSALTHTAPSHSPAPPTDRPPPAVPERTMHHQATPPTAAQAEDSDDDVPDLLPTTRADVLPHTSTASSPAEDIDDDMPSLVPTTSHPSADPHVGAPAANDSDDEMPDLLPPTTSRRRARSPGARSNTSMPDLVSVSDSDSDGHLDEDAWTSEHEYSEDESARDARDVEMMPDLAPVEDDGDSAWSDDSMPSLEHVSDGSGPIRRTVSIEEVIEPDAPAAANANPSRNPRAQANARPPMPPPPPFFAASPGQDLPGFRQMFQPMLADIISRVTGQGGDLNWDVPVFGSPQQGQGQPQMPPADFWNTGPPPPLNIPPRANTNAQPPPNLNANLFPSIEDLFDLVAGDGGPDLGLGTGPGAGLFNLLFGLGGPMREEQAEDPKRARRLIRGLEAVNDGMVKRITRVSDGEEGGSGLCAICWDSLLENDVADLWTKDKPTPAEERHQDSMDVETPEATPSAETAKEEPLPKVVALPCSHVFHTACLLPWFTRPHQTTCPSCRFDVDPESLTYEPRPRPTRPAPAPPTTATTGAPPTTAGAAPGAGPQQQQVPSAEEFFRTAFSALPFQVPNLRPPAQNASPNPTPQQTEPPQQPPFHIPGESIRIRTHARFIPTHGAGAQVNPAPGQPPQQWETEFVIPLPTATGQVIPPAQQQSPPTAAPQQQAPQPSPPSQPDAAAPGPVQGSEQAGPSSSVPQQPPAPNPQPQGPAPNPQTQNPHVHPHPPGQPTNGPPRAGWATVVADIYIGAAGPFPPGHTAAPPPTAAAGSSPSAPQTTEGNTAPAPPQAPAPPPPPQQQPAPARPQGQPSGARPARNGPAPQAQGTQGQRARAFPFPMPQMTQGPDGTWFAFQPPNPNESANVNANPFNGNPPRRPPPPREKRAWVPPPPPGPTLRQRVEQQEREKGLRCDDVSCGVGPSDEDPEPRLDERAKRMVSIHPHGHGHMHGAEQRVCAHAFHLPCLVSAERVAGWGAEADEAKEKEATDGWVEVGCPVCRAVGALPLEEWEEGVRALEAQLELD